MKEYRYVLINNAGHTWSVRTAEDAGTKDQSGTVLPQLLLEGWVPVRETPMGGGTSQLAHSLILLEREVVAAKPPKAAKAPKEKG